MADILPKVKWFLFISAISLMINISACTVAYMQSGDILQEYMIFENEEVTTYELQNKTNITAGNFALAVGSSFVPFVDLINLAFLGLDFITSLVVGIVVFIFGALKTLLIFEMVYGHLPFVDV